jgi:hypothetical protein
VLGMVDGLVQQLYDLVVIRRVGDTAAPISLTIDQAELAQHPHLTRDRWLFHAQQ